MNTHVAPLRHGTARSGTILIIVAGISALLMSVTIAYLANMRSDLEESERVIREAQARVVLIAALQYIQESSRLGWDRPGTPEHEEAYGWADVRDGSPGPKDRTGSPLYSVGSGVFPDIGGRAARFPFFAMERPPYAIKTVFTPNPVAMNPALSFGALVNYSKPDPQPAADTWSQFERGRDTPRIESVNKSWFRVYRDRNPTGTPAPPPVEPATFTITCGAGATQGFRDFNEAVTLGFGNLFNNDRAYFEILRSQERILWFRVEWTSAVGGSGMGVRVSSRDGFWDLPEINKGAYSSLYPDQQWWVNRNPLGSFLYIQRLEHEPNDW